MSKRRGNHPVHGPREPARESNRPFKKPCGGNGDLPQPCYNVDERQEKKDGTISIGIFN
jgi:hypothetical protein